MRRSLGAGKFGCAPFRQLPAQRANFFKGGIEAVAGIGVIKKFQLIGAGNPDHRSPWMGSRRVWNQITRTTGTEPSNKQKTQLQIITSIIALISTYLPGAEIPFANVSPPSAVTGTFIKKLMLWVMSRLVMPNFSFCATASR